MTVKVKQTKIKVKRQEHPNAAKYAGKECYEVGQAFRKLVLELDNQQFEDLQKGELVMEPEATDEFFDSVQKDDTIGLAIFGGIYEMDEDYNAAYKLLILDIDHQAGKARARDVTFESEKRPDIKGKEIDLFYEDFSFGLMMGMGEILKRGDKLFGVDEEQELTVNIHYNEEDELKPWQKEVIEDDKLTDDGREEMWERTAAKDFYFSVSAEPNQESDEQAITRVTFTPISYFDAEGARFDMSLSLNHLFDEGLQERLSQLTEDVFEFLGTEEQARKVFSELGFAENDKIGH